MRLLLPLLLLGCVGKGEVELHDSAAPDTGETGEAPADQTLCGAFSGFEAEGRVWIYGLATEGLTGSVTVTLTELDPVGLTASTTTREELQSEEASVVAETETSYVCDEAGLAVGTRYTSVERTADGVTTAEWALESFDPPWLVVGRDARVGAVWTGSTTRTTERDGQEPLSEALSWTFTVAGEEDLTLPAGRYEAIRVDSSGEIGETRWLSEGVGMVQTATLALASLVGG